MTQPDYVALRDKVAADEAALTAMPLDSASLIALAGDLLAAAPAPVSIRITLGRRVVAELSQDGTAADNAHFLGLKTNVVFNTGHSSLWWHYHLRATGRTLADVGWADPRAVIDMGGGVPLFAGGSVVGAVALSGLAHDADHDLIVTTMRRYLR
ncbi:MAG: heme-binding protein [Rhodobacterales bacterium]|nr:heme-binding protein [Rhodobacterales bacterium]MDX5498897.1 heme-binding protein [Rhodobacterales bacterium]